jgi:hypothetical protein
VQPVRVAAGGDQQLGSGVRADAMGGEQTGVDGGDHFGVGSVSKLICPSRYWWRWAIVFSPISTA